MAVACDFVFTPVAPICLRLCTVLSLLFFFADRRFDSLLWLLGAWASCEGLARLLFAFAGLSPDALCCAH